MKGPQADAGAGWWGKLYEENGRALLWDKPGEAFVKPDEWNTYEIVAVGARFGRRSTGSLVLIWMTEDLEARHHRVADACGWPSGSPIQGSSIGVKSQV